MAVPIGNVWDPSAWADGVWAAGVWADSGAGGGGGGGTTPTVVLASLVEPTDLNPGQTGTGVVRKVRVVK